ncbi:hypothetical protein KUTeg_007727 [Tegillarca granosa]|uniref:Uncharacterized protein n=1 Tax=Tegillarca granosa TaxID=220873 RepID=A0ABQ9FE25_TEGGR|nr:hypothetical protein KUTeg_007727 [Tegillarca granosa]
MSLFKIANINLPDAFVWLVYFAFVLRQLNKDEEQMSFKEAVTIATGGHGAEIDNPVVSPESDLEDILESEIIFNGDIAKKAEGIHPYDKQWELEEENEIPNDDDDEDMEQGEDDKSLAENQNGNTISKRSFVESFSFENGKLWPRGVVPYLINESSYGKDLFFGNVNTIKQGTQILDTSNNNRKQNKFTNISICGKFVPYLINESSYGKELFFGKINTIKGGHKYLTPATTKFKQIARHTMLEKFIDR